MGSKTHQHWADEYGVPLITFKKWLKDGAPFQNDGKMVTWLLNRKRIPAGAKKWLESKGVNISTRKAKKKNVPKSLETAEQFRDYYKTKLAESVEANDQNQVEFWAKLHLQYDESIRRNEAHSAKLGIDNGTVLPRVEVERILRAVFAAGNGCVQGALTAICEKLAGINEPAEIYRILKPAIVGGRLFAGFEKVKNAPGQPGIPDWIVDCVNEEFQQYIREVA